LSTRPIKASTLKWWGKRRWQIEGWFKTAKHRFGLHRFGQGTLLGVYRWLILSLTAYLIAHWSYLHTQVASPPDWGQAAQTALESIFPQIVVSLLLLEIERLAPLARSCGFDNIINPRYWLNKQKYLIHPVHPIVHPIKNRVAFTRWLEPLIYKL
jgi:hypothetical protein